MLTAVLELKIIQLTSYDENFVNPKDTIVLDSHIKYIEIHAGQISLCPKN